jgi:hypothetical protein
MVHSSGRPISKRKERNILLGTTVTPMVLLLGLKIDDLEHNCVLRGYGKRADTREMEVLRGIIWASWLLLCVTPLSWL